MFILLVNSQPSFWIAHNTTPQCSLCESPISGRPKPVIEVSQELKVGERTKRMNRAFIFDVVIGLLAGIVAGGALFLSMGCDAISAMCSIVATVYFWAGFFSGRVYPGTEQPSRCNNVQA